MIYTSYFANIKRVVNAGLEPVSISLITPYWVKVSRCTEVMPTDSILREYKSSNKDKDAQNRYINRYQSEVLSQVDLKSLADAWEENGNICLLCYERPETFCHRHILAESLRNIGYEVKEFEDYKK